MDESALIVAVPAAEPLVGRFREKFDSSAAVGVPAHVTLLYPFLPPDSIGASDIAALTTLFASTPAFDVAFRRTGRFGDHVLYLAPEPEDRLIELMRRIWARWPELPPYHGTIPREVVRPHLTVADGAGGEQLDRIDLAVAGGLPLLARFDEAALIDDRSGRWTTRQTFALGG
jgi:2'-5' RNA ligase